MNSPNETILRFHVNEHVVTIASFDNQYSGRISRDLIARKSVFFPKEPVLTKRVVADRPVSLSHP